MENPLFRRLNWSPCSPVQGPRLGPGRQIVGKRQTPVFACQIRPQAEEGPYTYECFANGHKFTSDQQETDDVIESISLAAVADALRQPLWPFGADCPFGVLVADAPPQVPVAWS